MTFRADLDSAVQGAVCSYMGRVRRYADEPFLGLDGPFGRVIDAPADLIARSIAGVGALFCDSSPFPISSRPANGRCAGTLYEVEALATCFFVGEQKRYTALYSTQPAQPTGVPGPILDVDRPFLTVGGNVFLGPPLGLLAGSPSSSFSMTPTSNSEGNRTNWRPGNNYVEDARVTKITAISGPDNCVGPGIPPRYPSLPDRTAPIVVGVNNGQIVIGAGNIAINGDLTIQVRVEFPDFVLNGDINLFSGSIEWGLPEFDFPDFPGFPSIPGYPDLPPPYNTNGLMVGAVVTTTSVDQNLIRGSVIYQGENPDIYGPRLGSINFYVHTGRNKAWTGDKDVKNRRQYIPCGTQFGAFDVRGTPGPGVVWTIDPVYARRGAGVDSVYSG